MANEKLTDRQKEILDLVAEHQPIGCNGIREIESPELTGNSAAAKSSSISQVLKKLEKAGLIEIERNGGDTDKLLYELTIEGMNRTNYYPESQTGLVKSETKLSNGEPEISNLSFDETVEVYQLYHTAEQHSQWKKAELAHHVKSNANVWGESSLKSFAEQTNIGYEYARILANTFEAFQNPSDRITDLSFSHHRTAVMNSENPVQDIREAGEGWSVRQLENHLKDKNVKKITSGSSDETGTGQTTQVEKGLMTRAVTMKKETVRNLEKLKDIFHEPNSDAVIEKIVNQVMPSTGVAGIQLSLILKPEFEKFYKTVSDYLHGADEQEIFEYIVRDTARRIEAGGDKEELTYEMDGEQ